MFCQVGHTNSVTVATFGLVGQEKWREQNHRHLAHNIPSHHALGISTHQSMDVKFAGKWGSALKGNSALRAHVARAAGIELAHNEGQCVIHFLWDMRKFYDSIKAHLLIPQLVAMGLPARDFGLGIVDTQITEMPPSRQRIQRHHQWLCNQHSGGLPPELLLGQRAPF